MKILLRILD